MNDSWNQFHSDQAVCERDNAHWIETDNMGAMQNEMPLPSVVDQCLAAKGWRRTDAYPYLTFVFPVLPAPTRP
jgi:hypothetical protein